VGVCRVCTACHGAGVNGVVAGLVAVCVVMALSFLAETSRPRVRADTQ
jgi:hypothetical protein